MDQWWPGGRVAARQAVDGRFKSRWFQDFFWLVFFNTGRSINLIDTDRSIDLIYWVEATNIFNNWVGLSCAQLPFIYKKALPWFTSSYLNEPLTAGALCHKTVIRTSSLTFHWNVCRLLIHTLRFTWDLVDLVLMIISWNNAQYEPKEEEVVIIIIICAVVSVFHLYQGRKKQTICIYKLIWTSAS